MYIIQAAIFKDGNIYWAKRHSDIIKMKPNERTFFHNCEQGFLTNELDFVSREEAARIAYEAGQIKEQKKILFSEDLW